MSFLRGAPQLLPRRLAQTASFQRGAGIQQQLRTYAETKNGAQPKILNESPPDESNASEEVKQHNEEVDRRADRPHDGVKDKDVEKDKVPKGYWQGSQAGADKESQ